MEKEFISFDSLSIIEWYDGIVRAIGVSKANNYLIVLLDWDFASSNKLYGVLDLDKSTLSRVKNCFDEKQDKTKTERWRLFSSVYEEFIEKYNGELYILLAEPKLNIEIPIKTSDTNEYKKILTNYSIERIV